MVDRLCDPALFSWVFDCFEGFGSGRGLVRDGRGQWLFASLGVAPGCHDDWRRRLPLKLEVKP